MEIVAEFNAINECGITVNSTNQGGYDDIRPLPASMKQRGFQRRPRLTGPSTMRVASR
jgi:hypothetical protein